MGEDPDTFYPVGPAGGPHPLVSRRKADLTKNSGKFGSNSVLFGNHFPDGETEAQRAHTPTVNWNV